MLDHDIIDCISYKLISNIFIQKCILQKPLIIEKLSKHSKLWNRLIILLIKTGNLELLKYYKENYNKLLDGVILIPNSIKYNQKNILEWTLEEYSYLFNNNRYRQLQYECCAIAAEQGNIDILKFLKDNKFKWNSKTTNMAAINGNPILFYWLLKNNCPLGDKITINACRYNNLKLLKWFYKYINIVYSEELSKKILKEYYNEELYTIAKNLNNTEILDWIITLPITK